jgi:orotate phosphoribosyltransferase-like protein
VDLVIRLAEEGKYTGQIAEAAHISLKCIGIILRRYTGEEETAAEKSMSVNSRAFKLFKENKDLVDVAIILDIEADEVFGMHSDYLRLSNMDKLVSIYREVGDEIHLLEWLYNELKW